MGRHSVTEDRSFVRSLVFFVLKWLGLALIPLLVLRGLWGLVTPDSAADEGERPAKSSSPGTTSPAPTPSAAPTTAASPPAQTPPPKLQVLNGTDKTGVALELANLLRQSGREVVNVEKAAGSYAKTTIFFQPGHEQAAHDLATAIGGAQVQAPSPDKKLNKDIPLTVVVGADYKPPEALAPAAGSPTPGGTPAASPTAKSTAVQVQVLNGTDISGLAQRAAAKLRDKGYDVVAVKNAASQGYQTTVVFFQPGHERSASDVVSALGTGTVKPAVANLRKDVPLTVVVGKDFE